MESLRGRREPSWEPLRQNNHPQSCVHCERSQLKSPTKTTSFRHLRRFLWDKHTFNHDTLRCHAGEAEGRPSGGLSRHRRQAETGFGVECSHSRCNRIGDRLTRAYSFVRTDDPNVSSEAAHSCKIPTTNCEENAPTQPSSS